ncbi:MAG: glycerol kinase 5, partial [Promethearchaeota archaeon]
MSYILTLDVGTTNIKAFLIDENANIVAQAKRRPRYITDEPGQVEQDPLEIWYFSKEVMEEVIASKNLKASDINSIAVSTQRASFMMWDKITGEIYSNIITWQDNRAAKFAKKKTKKLFFRIIRAVGKIARLFGSMKMLVASMLRFPTDYASIRTAFFLENHLKLKKMIKDPETTVAWGQIDSWLLWNLTEGKVHATDFSNASMSAMLDPFLMKWNTMIMKHLGLHSHFLPEIKETNAEFGSTNLFGGGDIPIRCLVADQQASLFGLGCFNQGDMKVTNGTGSFIDINTGQKPFASKRRLYPLIAWKIDGQLTYMLEGFSHNTGSIIEWVQKELGLYDSPEMTERMALSVKSTEGVYFLPTLSTGLSYPYWDSSARGNIFGINLTTKKAHIVRAILEGICFRIKDLVDGILKDTKLKVNTLKTDGGVSQNDFFLQFLSDMLDAEIQRPNQLETTALGAAFFAGLATG